MENYFEKLELQKWVCLQPKETHTGCGIIVDVVDTHKDLVDMGYGEKSYIVQTDFGNTFTMTEGELLSSYHLVRIEEDPLGRMFRQRELLDGCMEKYYAELIK